MLQGSEELNRTLDEYYHLVVRRRWWLLLPTGAVALGALVLSLLLPGIYRSEAVILVEHQTVPEHFVVPNVASDLRNRINTMTQQILSRTRLLQIIDEFGLYAEEKKSLVPEELVELMRTDIHIELVQSDSKKSELNAFKISYGAEEPRVAQAVTNRLTSLFIEENLKVREQQSLGTTSFLQAQLDAAREDLEKQEERLRDFKTRHLGELPEQQAGNLQILSGMHVRYQNTAGTLNRAREQRVYLESLINQYRSAAEAGGTLPGVTPPRAKTVAEDELAKLRAKRADLLAHYTDKHPDIRKMDEQIAQAEALLAQVSQEQKDTGGKKPGEPGAGDASGVSTSVAQLQSQFESNTTEINNLSAEQKRIEGEIRSYERRLNLTPVREQQLSEILRDYNLSKKNYEDLLKKKNESELATNLEKRQQGEQFRLLDPPSLPEKPSSPDRLRINLFGLGLGFGLAVGLAFMAEVRDRSLHTEKDLVRLVPLPLVVGVPELLNAAELQRRAWKRKGEWVAGSLLLLAVVAGQLLVYWWG